MAERSSLTQGVQVGVESTPGTAVPADKLLQSIGIGPSVQVEFQEFRPMGQKFQSIIVPGKEWTESDIEGVGSYTELTYLFASVFKDPGAPATVDTSAKKFTFAPAARAEDTVKTFTVEQGGSVRAHSFAYGIVQELGLVFNRDGIEVSGTMLGRQISDGITMTAAPTTIEEKPILPTDIDVYMDPTSGALGSTKLTRVLEAEFTIGDRFGPVWVLNSANDSWVAHVETEPTVTLRLMVEADAQGMGILSNMRAGATRFLRVAATSDDLAGAATQKYALQIDMAGKVGEVGEFSDEDGVYAIEWTFNCVYDGTWTKAIEANIWNKLTAL